MCDHTGVPIDRPVAMDEAMAVDRVRAKSESKGCGNASPASPPTSASPSWKKQGFGWKREASPETSPTGSERELCTRRKRFPSLKALSARCCPPLLVLAILLFPAVFVGLEIVDRYVFPGLPVALRHLILTLGALCVTAAGCFLVMVSMKRNQRRLSETTDRLARLLDAYVADRNCREVFQNPNLKHCSTLIECGQEDCPMYEAEGERCWQRMALADARDGMPRLEFAKCRQCLVYRLSCPDKLTELGESFNNLMFLLRLEADQGNRLRARIAEKQKMASIGQLASGIAHEVGNPLSSISSIVQVLQRSEKNGSMNRQLDLIQTHIKRISTTVRQLGRLARPANDRWKLMDIGRALEECALLVSFDPRADKVNILYDRPEGLTPGYGIQGQLQQVFINLCLNALDAMPEGGTLRLQVKENKDEWIVEIRDTGGGIPPEAGERIFEPFYTTKAPGDGTGLGLAVSYDIVQRHFGAIDYRSDPGKGTAFFVRIPLLRSPPERHHDPGNRSLG